jgi:hypothetical protein
MCPIKIKKTSAPLILKITVYRRSNVANYVKFEKTQFVKIK